MNALMRLFAPGSAPWLLAHEMRLTWRFITSRRGGGKSRAWILWLILLAGLGSLAWWGGLPLGRWVRDSGFAPGPFEILTLDLALLLIWTLMLSQTLSNAAMVFYQRGDLDLLFSSPVPSRRVLSVRTLAIAGNVLPFLTVLLSAIILPVGIIAHPSWLAVYVVLGALSVLAAVAGVWLAMGLFAAIGPRRTRTVSQILAALIGATMFLIGQSYNLVGRGRYRGFFHDVRDFAASGRFDPGSAWSWPARAALGEPVPLIVFALVALAIFAASTAFLGERFARNAAAAIGSLEAKPLREGRDRTRFTGTPFSVLVRKELRLLARDPALMSQILLQMLYLTPIAAVMLKNAHAHLTAAVATGVAGVTFLSGQLAGSLGWVTISAEESPELLQCAPVSPERLRRAKVAAVLIPVFALVGIPLIVLFVLNPLAGLVGACGCAATASSTTLIEIWRQRPGKRSEFRRNRGSSVLVPLIEVLVGLCFGGAVAMLVFATVTRFWWIIAPISLVPILIAVGVTWAARPRSANLTAVAAA
jgi:ABC-2 type transport system permease protein